MTYKPPPYNYCNYRCDQCEDAEDCLDYKKEQTSRMKHILRGEDPYDMKAVMEDIGESFAETTELIEKIAKEKGIDRDQLQDESGYEEHRRARDETKNHPLHKRAYEFLKLCSSFLEESKKRLIITPEIQPYFDEIEWHRWLLPPKTARALMWIGEKNEYSLEDSRMTADLIITSLEKCQRALKQIAFFRPGSKEFMKSLKDIIEELLIEWDEFKTKIENG